MEEVNKKIDNWVVGEFIIDGSHEVNSLELVSKELVYALSVSVLGAQSRKNDAIPPK